MSLLGIGVSPAHVRHRGDALAPIIADALGVWDAADYQSATRKVIKNKVATLKATDPNISTLPRRAFRTYTTTNGFFSNPVSLTITDNAAAAPDGSQEASTLVSASALDWQMIKTHVLPAGTYTVALSLKDLGSSSTSFRFYLNGGTQNVFTASGSWQRFTFQFTIASSTNCGIYLRAPSGASQANFAICDLEIFPGTSDLNTTALTQKPICCRNQDLMLGRSALDSAVSITSGVVDASTIGQVMMPDTSTMAAFTVIYVAKRTTDPTNVAWQPVVNNLGANAYNFCAGPGAYASGSAGGTVGVSSNNSSKAARPQTSYPGTAANIGHLWTPTGGDFIVGCQRGNASVVSSWLNGRKILEEGTLNAIDHQGRLGVMCPSTGAAAVTSGLSWTYVALWNRALSDAEIKAATVALQAKYTTTKRLVLFLGDSITAGAVNNGIGHNLSPKRVGSNWGVPGTVVGDSVGAAVDALITGGPPMDQYLLSLAYGANDLNTASPNAAAFTANLAAYIDARRAAGWNKIVGTTVLPRQAATDIAAFNTARAVANTTIRSWVGGRLDAVSDWAADATMGPDTAPNDPTYYNGDKIHPNTAGHVILETITRAAINSVA